MKGQGKPQSVCEDGRGRYAAFIKCVNRVIAFAAKELGIPMFFWTSLQINVNSVSQPHCDPNAPFYSIILGLGDYEEGFLVVEGTRINIKGKAVLFNGLRKHWSEQFTGQRLSIVAFVTSNGGMSPPMWHPNSMHWASLNRLTTSPFGKRKE